MTNQRKTPLFLLLTVLLVLCSVVPAFGAKVKKPSAAKSTTVYFSNCEFDDYRYCSVEGLYGIYIKNIKADAQITNLKVSNPAVVAQVEYADWENDLYPYIYVGGQPDETETRFTLRNNLKANVSFDVTQDGKVYHLKSKVTFKARNSVISFKIDRKQYYKKLRGFAEAKLSMPTSGLHKVTVKQNSAFTKPTTLILNYGEDDYRYVKNGSKVDFTNLESIACRFSYKPKTLPKNAYPYVRSLIKQYQGYMPNSFLVQQIAK